MPRRQVLLEREGVFGKFELLPDGAVYSNVIGDLNNEEVHQVISFLLECVGLRPFKIVIAKVRDDAEYGGGVRGIAIKKYGVTTRINRQRVLIQCEDYCRWFDAVDVEFEQGSIDDVQEWVFT